MSKKIIAIVIVVVVCALAALGIWLYVIFSEPPAPQNKVKLPGDDSVSSYTYNGNISSNNIQDCVSPMALELKKIYVKEGDQVKKGDLLFLLDDSDVAAALSQAQAGIQLAQANLEKAQLAADTLSLVAVKSALDAAQAAYTEAKSNLDRVASLQPLGGISQSDFEKAQIAVVTAEGQYNQAKSNYETYDQQSSQSVRAAQAQLAQARANYQAAQVSETKRRVTANFDGVVADIWAYENNDLAPGQKIMDIVDYNNLILQITVDQFEISQFKLSDRVPVYINSLNSAFSGTVSKISNQAIKTGEVSSFVVTIDLDHDPALKIGLLAEVRKNV